MTELKEFILRGNVVSLAVAVVVGAAFSNVINSLVADMITPLLGIPGKADFSELDFTIRQSTFYYGRFLNAIISFLSVSVVVFFFVVKPINHLMSLHKTKPQDADVTKSCPECLSSIPSAARRCAFCTAELSSTSAS